MGVPEAGARRARIGLVLSVVLTIARTDAANARTIDPLVASELSKSQQVEVSVALRPATSSGPDATDVTDLRRMRQDATISRLAAGSFALRYRFSHLDGFVATITRDAYDRLLTDPEVESVYANRILHATLAEGRTLARVNAVQRAGIDGARVTAAILDTGID